MSQTVVHKDATRKRENLRFVLQKTEGSGENQAVIIALEFRSVIMALGVAMLLSETLIRYQLLPVHHILGCKSN